jgi:hypothetical protein
MNRQIPSKKNSEARSKTSWLLLAPLILITLAVLGAFVWWQYYKTTPAYSLALLIDAAKRHDTATLDKLVDSDKVVENFMTGLEKRDTGTASDVFGALRRRLQEVAPSKSESFKARIREGIRQRINELGQTSGDAPFAIMAVALYFKTDIATIGTKATVRAVHQSQELELEMTRKDDFWQVTSARDDALAAQIAADILKDVPKGLSPIDLTNPLGGTLPKLPIP